ncbi:hypothetical protein [Methylomonas koyamae]|nr:hypothetical protein [Methylomonas koyamae]
MESKSTDHLLQAIVWLKPLVAEAFSVSAALQMVATTTLSSGLAVL